MGQQLALTEMMSVAKQKGEQVAKMEGDWKGQIEQLHAVVKLVSDWQRPIFARFGEPESHRLSRPVISGEVIALERTEHPRYKIEEHVAEEDLYYDGRYGGLTTSQTSQYFDGLMAIGSHRNKLHCKKGEKYTTQVVVGYDTFTYEFPGGWTFKGATILQGLNYDSASSTVIYRSTLKTDENWFLQEMLPEVVKIPMADPDYELFNIQIKVPRAVLVKESLHRLSEIISEPTPTTEKIAKQQHRLRRAVHSVFFDSHGDAKSFTIFLTFIGGVGLGITLALLV